MCATADGAALLLSDAAPKALNKQRFDPFSHPNSLIHRYQLAPVFSKKVQ
jgi:hypothetical protein